MSDEHPVADAVVVKRFWHNYLSILEKVRITQAAILWYRKHADAYIRAHRGFRLAAHTPAHIDDYLKAKGRMAAAVSSDSRRLALAGMSKHVGRGPHSCYCLQRIRHRQRCQPPIPGGMPAMGRTMI